MKIQVLSIFIFLLVVGCSKNTENVIPTLVIDVKESKSLDLSKFADIEKIVSLETTSDCLIKKIDRIFISEEYILIVDLNLNEILLFDIDGYFIRKIGKKGQGPDEYIMWNDVFYDNESKLIYANERIKREIFIYDLDGNLLKKRKSNFWFTNLCKIGNNYWVYTPYFEENKNGYSLMLLNEDLSQINGFLPQKSFFTATEDPNFIKRDDNCYFTYQFSNVIYQLVDLELVPFLLIDFKDKTLPYNRIQNMEDEKEYEDLKKSGKYMGNMKNYVFCGDVLYFSFSSLAPQSISYNVRYNISNKELYIFESTQLVSFPYDGNVIDKLDLFNPICSFEDKTIYAVGPYNLDERAFSDIKANLFPMITDESNPLLFFMKEKK